MSKATLTGPLAAVLLFGGLFENNIETSKPDAPIRAWLATTGNTAWLAHAAALAVGGVVLMVFAQVLRVRLSAGTDDVLTRMVGALGTALGTVLVLGAAVFAAVPIGRVFEGAPAPDPSTYRYLMAASASMLVIFLSVPAAALAGAVGAQVLRGTTAPRWLGYAGIAAGILTLVSAFVAPLAVFSLWLLVTGIALATGRSRVTAARVEPAHA